MTARPPRPAAITRATAILASCLPRRAQGRDATSFLSTMAQFAVSALRAKPNSLSAQEGKEQALAYLSFWTAC